MEKKEPTPFDETESRQQRGFNLFASDEQLCISYIDHKTIDHKTMAVAVGCNQLHQVS